MKDVKIRNATLLLSLIFIFAVGLLVFCKGFLLKRIEVPHHSKCMPHSADAKEKHTCTEYPRKFKRVVWLLIDALRHDFTVYDDTLDPDPPLYRNKLPYIRDLIRDQPAHAKLFRFVADPPTTTMQRLKAITTGGLPTFVDVSSNFNSYEISEDSLIRQVYEQGLNVTFMGDDTWQGLYDKLLTRSFYFPSFNVKDLHTVDNGVLKHLVPVMKAGEADFVIGHFLGVDHCGHIFGPSHPSMADKLRQMNAMIQDVVKAVDKDTIVFAFGDHGMTATGDHGGESESETGAALFVYSARPLFCNKQVYNREISQIDLVPTVSLLLGIPIPFSSLGAAIPELFIDCQRPIEYVPVVERVLEDVVLNEIRAVYSNQTTLELLNVLKYNSKQIEQYLDAYSQLSGDFPQVELHNLHKTLSNARLAHSKVLSSIEKSKYTKSEGLALEVSEDMDEAAELYYKYIQNVKLMCRQIWAKFDDLSIQLGISVAVMACILTFLLNCSSAQTGQSPMGYRLVLTTHMWFGFAGGFVCGILCVLVLNDFSFTQSYSLNEILNFVSTVCLCAAVGVILGLGYTQWKTLYRLIHIVYSYFENLFSFQRSHQITQFSFSGLLPVVSVGLMGLYSISLLSNSYILYEFSMAIFLLQTVLILMVFSSIYVAAYHHSGKGEDMDVLGVIVNHFIGRKGVLARLPLKHYALLTLGIAIITRISKAFRTCRDLQVDCTLSHFTFSLSVAMEMVNSLGKYRFVLTFLSVVGVPIFSSWLISMVGKLNWWHKFLLYLVQPLVSVFVCLHWLLQAVDASGYVRLTHLQHVFIPRLVYLICGGGVLCLLVKNVLNKHYIVNRGSDRSLTEGESSSSLQTTNLSSYGRSGSQQNCSSCSCKQNLKSKFVEWSCVVLCVWQVLVMLHNDGLAMGACLMAYHVVLFIILSGMTLKLWHGKRRGCEREIVCWGCVRME
jgi:phosphatidylinositol glycan class O